jgi:uroporphyrin-III C-methyltransferase
MKGKVYLVGAGPGDPDLLTVKAARLLRSANAVLYDELVAPAILQLVSSSAHVHNVGKRCGTQKVTQQEINSLMVTLAAAGQQVIRLKGGDPSIFGRAREEIEPLRRAGVAFEIVPGVTAALGAAAAAGIPLTCRGGPEAVTLMTGHRAADQSQSDWHRFVGSGATLVIYMPGHDYGETARRLRISGMLSETPCAIVSRATSAEQKVHLTSVAGLAAAPRMPTPALLIVGEVVQVPGSQDFAVTPEIEELARANEGLDRKELAL